MLNGDRKCFTVNITDDEIVEAPETITYQIVSTDPPTITIENNDQFSISDNDGTF